MAAFHYVFTALRGIQAGRCYYTAMCPLRLVARIFIFDEEEVAAELRAQRTLNRNRIPEIARYILDNPREYVFSAITASIDAEVKFEPIEAKERAVGLLHIPMTAKFLVNDGQHRRAAIEEALKQRPELGEETIPVVFFLDSGLKRSQQMFADLNKHAVRPTKSLSILYDHRDPSSELAIRLASELQVFRGLTEMEKTSISNRSRKLFTLSAIYLATSRLLKLKKLQVVTEEQFKLASDFWTEIGNQVPDWTSARTGRISSAELRRDYIHAHGIALQALAIAGAALLDTYPDEWRNKLKQLRKVDWSRSNVLWEGRATVGGNITKVHNNVLLTACHLKTVLGLRLSPDDQILERRFRKAAKEVRASA